MSDVEKFEADYRALATKLIYALVAGDLNPEEKAELDRKGDELARLNAADFSREGEREPVTA